MLPPGVPLSSHCIPSRNILCSRHEWISDGLAYVGERPAGALSRLPRYNPMLYSPSGQIAFAHFPKTAGSSLGLWFRERFPDAQYVDTNNPHVPVRASLERLGLVPGRARRLRLVRETLRVFEQGLKTLHISAYRCDLRIIGVIRDPFEMIVSLYKYWRRHPPAEHVHDRLYRSALTGSFREFFQLAVVERLLGTYERFFDVDGPAWHGTRLINFECLREELAAEARELGIPRPDEPPAFTNAAPGGLGDLEVYRCEVEDLLDALHARFHWYYNRRWTSSARHTGRRLRLAA